MKKIILFSGILILNIYSVFSQCTSSITSTNALCYGVCNGAATVTGSNGVEPYSYHWSNSATTQTITNLCHGTYQVTVTDANNCTHVNSVTILQPTQLVCSITTVNNTCFGACNGTATAIATGGTPPYSYYWSNGALGLPISTLCAGTYGITVTDANGCHVVQNFTITEPFPLTVSIAVIHPSTCGQCNGTLSAVASGGNPPYTFLWTNLVTTHINSNLCAGYNSVTVTDNSGCVNAAVIFLNDSISSACQNTISGNTFKDLNSNGIFDIGEPLVPYSIIRVMPGPQYFSSDNNGVYIAHVDTGIFTLDVPNPPQYYTQYNSVPAIHFSTPGDTVSNVNIGFHALDVLDLRVCMNPFSNARPGFNVLYSLNYRNEGTMALNGTVKLVKDPLLALVSAVPSYDSIIGDTMIWLFQNFTPAAMNSITLEYHLDASVPIGTSLSSHAWILPVIGDTIPQNNYFNSTQIVTGSLDPNDKTVNPTLLTPLMLADEQPLTYTIRFQNTGTDTAFTVIVTDTLSSNLDIPTFQMLAASHPCTYRIFDSGIVEFKFENILLADSNTNEPRSHGFVQFSMKAKSSLILGDEVNNFADIYFDFNTPVRTNTANTTISDLLKISDVNSSVSCQLSVFPNPFTNLTKINYSIGIDSEITLEVYDILGNRIETLFNGYQQKGNYDFVFGKQSSAVGLYFIKLKVNGNSSFVKAVKFN